MRRAAAEPPELPGYRHVDLLGSGGFADVFLYEQKLPRRQVAVKVLLAEGLARDTRAQFVAEANLMAQLSAHPYIVTIFHADVAADGRPYFVMEYCSGPSLATQLKRSPFGVEDALRTGVRLAGAVATAHAAGILHRDIKPANVLTNDYGWPALTDFGISSTLEGEIPVHTMTFTRDDRETGAAQSAVGMSVPWSPPELFDDDPRADTRSDVFSLAATVHTLLAGRSPFEIPGRSNGALDLIGRIERGAITAIGRADVPRSLQEVLRKGMAVRPDDRYASAVEFARALQRVELELGYSATSIEVPNLVARGDGPAPSDGATPSADADETRARSVQTIDAQREAGAAAGPDADATRARSPQRIEAQRGIPADDQTVIRHGGAADAVAGPAAARIVTEDTVVRTKPHPAPGESSAEQPRRSRVGVIVAAVAGVIVVAAVGIAIAFAVAAPSRSSEAEPNEPPTGEDAVIAATVPTPVVPPGVPSADGTSVTFAVSHEAAEDGDRYRWQRADGSGDVAVADAGEIVVAPVTPGQTVCIDVQVQRGSKTSDTTRGCTP
jgi:serine/threonine protein kinase